MIYVTHDQVEAMTMADRIVVLRTGRIEQVGTPLELYNHPRNQFVAGFIGSPKMNFLPAIVRHHASGAAVDVASGAPVMVANLSGAVQNGQTVTLGIRPEHVELGPGGTQMNVNLTEQLGGNTVLHGTLGNGQAMVVQIVGQARIKRGDAVPIVIPSACCHVFNEAGDNLLART